MKALPAGLDLLAGRRINHVAVVAVISSCRRWARAPAGSVLVHRAALHRHASHMRRSPCRARRTVDDENSGRLTRAGRDRRARCATPRRSAAHALDRQQHLLTVGAHAEHDNSESQSPCGRAARAPPCRPGSGARSAPPPASGRSRRPSRPSPCARSAHRVLAHRAAEQRRQRATDRRVLVPAR